MELLWLAGWGMIFCAVSMYFHSNVIKKKPDSIRLSFDQVIRNAFIWLLIADIVWIVVYGFKEIASK